ncbi:traf2 and NCK-interacting protein kinase-like [Xenopus laevis]|uniref:Traf2 and NCK-interacting protein kinase-like n=1 Tax=Xenopus laevis TaxID=8355 RepID=A0A8J1MG55_XENLA|nr:traf2 and NCK-interacting protein kinase-like [Xenopus laevis]
MATGLAALGELPEESGSNTCEPETSNTSEEQVDPPKQQKEEQEDQEEKADSSPCLEIPEDSGSNTCEPETPNTSEEQIETLKQQEIPEESGSNTYEPETPNTSEEKVEALKQQEEEQLVEEQKADSSPCQEIPEESGSNTCEPETTNTSEEQMEALEQQELPEESGSNTCQPETPNTSKEQVEAPNQKEEQLVEEQKADSSPCQEMPEESGSNTCQPETPNTSEEKVEATEQQKPRTYIQALEPIGEDNYGVIYNGWHHKEQKEVAITIIKDTKKQKEILKKMKIFENIPDHKNIVGFYGAFYNHASKKMPHYEGLWVSTELYTGSSLKELINGQKQKSLPENTIAYICKEVLQGLSHLDKNKVIHHDLRPGNIMVASSGDIKIIDFTSATKGPRSHATSGAIPYMAPEVMANIGSNTVDYTTKADVWSLGISALEMAEGYYPFSRFPENKRMKRIMHGPAPTLLWDTWSDKFHFFISECLQKNPARRPSAEQLLAHPFISNIQNERGVKKFIKRHLQKCKGTAHSHYNSLH